jgi:hypothetical protein
VWLCLSAGDDAPPFGLLSITLSIKLFGRSYQTEAPPAAVRPAAVTRPERVTATRRNVLSTAGAGVHARLCRCWIPAVRAPGLVGFDLARTFAATGASCQAR